MKYASDYHAPVMVEEVMQYLRPERGGVFLDGTLGGGGHAEALLTRSLQARLIGVDRDPEALEEAGRRLAGFGDRLRRVRSNYAEATEAAGLGADSLDGVLLDLGISSHQIDATERGFTFRSGAPLDMRMGGAEEGGEAAAELLNSLTEEELARIFFRYGEEQRSRKLARILAEKRAVAPITTSDQLVDAIERAVPRATPQDKARIFQALRIAVNGELEALETALPRFLQTLKPDGVLVVLSYHSLEDRVVKDHFREWSRSCICPPALPICQCRGAPLGKTLTRKPVMASEAEVSENPRARSARLRAWMRA